MDFIFGTFPEWYISWIFRAEIKAESVMVLIRDRITFHMQKISSFCILSVKEKSNQVRVQSLPTSDSHIKTENLSNLKVYFSREYFYKRENLKKVPHAKIQLLNFFGSLYFSSPSLRFVIHFLLFFFRNCIFSFFEWFRDLVCIAELLSNTRNMSMQKFI